MLGTTIEIEDYDGKTLCAMHISKKISTKDITKFYECNIVDEKAPDYIFKTDDNLIRIQRETKE
jgi:hypothetical protein